MTEKITQARSPQKNNFLTLNYYKLRLVISVIGIVYSATSLYADTAFEPRTLSLDTLIDSVTNISYSDPELVKVFFDTQIKHNSKKSLRIDINKSLGNVNFEGIYSTPANTHVWIELPENDIDFSSFTKLNFNLKVEGARHAYITLGLADSNKNAMNVEMCPIDAGDWRRYTCTLWRKMTTPKYLSINVYMSGYNVDEKAEQSIYIDDLQLSNTPLRQARGWSIDPTIIAINQAGFNPYKEKLALANSKYIKQTFDIIDNSDGKSYFSGVIQPMESPVGTTGIIDFTNLIRPGHYKVVSGSLKSASFDIGPKAYDPCISLVSDWVANMRCGCKTDYHAPCHLDDGYLPTLDKDGNIISRKHIDVSGGWHDAGDTRTYYDYSVRMAELLLPAYQAGWDRDRNADGDEDFYDSALWAMKHLVKIRNPSDGGFFFKAADRSFVEGSEIDYRFGNYWTDNIPNNQDDRYVLIANQWGVNYDTWAIESIARFFEVAKPKDKPLANKLLTIAEERWNYWFHPETGRLFTAEYSGTIDKGHSLRNLGWYGNASLKLYKVTGKKNKKYYEFAMKCADKILESQNRTFSEQGNITGDVHVTSDRFMKTPHSLSSENKYTCENFIADCMKTLPDDKMYYKWRSFLVISTRWWMDSTRNKWAPFSLPHGEIKEAYMGKGDFGYRVNRNKQTNYQYIVPNAGATVIGESAFHMWNVAGAINDIELENLALRQLQWMIGFNPFGVSFVCEFGEDYIDQFYSFSQGIMPGQIGTSAGTGKYTGVIEKGIPGVIRPMGSESHTRSGVHYAAALATLSSSAKVKLKIMSGDAPYRGEVEIVWAKTKSVVFKGKTDSLGYLPVADLDGGQLYTIKVGETIIPLKAISGTKISQTINLNDLIELAVTTPDIIEAGKTFNVIVSVTNTGRENVNSEILCFGESVRSDQQSKKIELTVGETKNITWSFTAGNTSGPYVLTFKEGREGSQMVDISGKID